VSHLRPAARPKDADPAALSRALLRAGGCAVIALAGFPGEGLLAVGYCSLRAVAVTTPRGRFGVLVTLLGSGVVARLVRAGVAVEVHAWSRRPRGWIVEVHGLGPADFGAEG
jgi:hypothetical protein